MKARVLGAAVQELFTGTFGETLSGWQRDGELMGEGTPEPVNFAPQSAESAGPALLCLHGFGCVPNEVEPLSSLGVELQLRTLAPLLPGHGTHARDLAKTRYRDWYAAAERAFLELVKQRGSVIVGGQSMGALLALDLAARYPMETRGVVAYANAIALGSPFPAVPLKWLGRLPIESLLVPKVSGPNIADPIARATHLTYSAQPIVAAASLQKAGREVETRLGQVRCPVFLAHGALDLTAPPNNALRVARQLTVSDVEVHLFPRSAHILTKDYERADVTQRTRAFLMRLVG